MISKIMAIGGVGLLAFGAYCWWAKNKKTVGAASAAQKELEKAKTVQPQEPAPPGTMPAQQTGNMVNPYNGAMRSFDINPQVLFSPPTTTVMMPSTDIADVVMINSAHQLVN